MKLATRITLAVGSCAVVLFGGSGVLQLRNEQRDLTNVAKAEALLFGRSLQIALDNALRDRQVEDVTKTVRALAEAEPSVSIFVFDDAGKLVAGSEGARPTADTHRARALAHERTEPLVEFAPAHNPSLLRVALHIREETHAPRASMVIEKPLDELQRDLRTTRRNIAVTSSLFVVTVAWLTWVLMRRHVGVPLRRLVEDMDRVKAGQLKLRAAPQSMDEVGETHAHFERLVADLDAARERGDQELEARRRMERGLQRADKLITLGQLSAVMAHEIGSPLQVLEGRARALKKHAADPQATIRTADMLIEQTERITRIVGQMLSITRRRPPVRLRIDAEASIQSVCALLELEARRRNVEFLVERSGDTNVIADPDQLQQVVLNLMRNALDASVRGGKVWVRLVGNPAELCLDVIDEGEGLAEDIKKHLFEPFFTTKADSGGSGLGLSVVRSILQDHGGSVEFVEPVSRGCHVRVSIAKSNGENPS